MLFFRDEEHAARWCDAWRQPVGALLDMRTAWGLAQAWYSAPRNTRDWRRYPPDEVAAIFTRLELRGDFWRV